MIFKSRYKLDIPNVDILSWVFEHVHKSPERPIFLDAERPELKFTAAELLSVVKRVRSALRDRIGIKTGDVVLGFGSNSYFYPALIFGIIAAGGIYSGLNYQYGKQGEKNLRCLCK